MTLSTRIVGILTRPAEDWRTIAIEPATTEALMRDYAAPLAAIPPLCAFVGLSLVGVNLPLFGMYRIGLVRGLVGEIVAWVFALVGVWIGAIVIDKLAPTFHSRGGLIQALKLVVFAMTPVWIGGVLNLVPALAPLELIAALYAIYLFYLGLPRVMSTPPDRVIPYMAVSALAAIVISFIVQLCARALTGIGSYGAL